MRHPGLQIIFSPLALIDLCDIDAKPWTSLMRLLQERDSSDSELLVYAVTLINKTLHGLPDQDSYYDQIEFLEALGMQQIAAR